MFCKDIKKWLITHQSVQPSVRRLMTLLLMISALIRGGRASLQCMGDSMELDTDLESRIKKQRDGSIISGQMLKPILYHIFYQ